MATRRAGAKVIDWAAFAERVPANQKSQFNALKSRADALKSRLNALPEKAPTIDWEAYRKIVPVAGLVDKFQKQFDALKVPQPKDTASAAIDVDQKDMDKNVADFVVVSNKRIVDYEGKISVFKNMIPFEEMTIEEYQELYPELKEQRKKYPYWPHYAVWEL